MEIQAEQVRAYRLRGHHLEQKLPPDALEQAAGACGFQNSPPGAWETAAWNRVAGCTPTSLHAALEEEKRLLQAWSYRGVPVVFPTGQSDVFLTPLAARPGEQPWIYTRGITLALEALQMTFDQLLPLVRQAAAVLDAQTVKSKEELDRVLAARVEGWLPPEKRPLWTAPSMYGSPDRQTVGGAVVSFMLRPCAFSSLVVFGRREGGSPTFTSPGRWLGRVPEPCPDADGQLVRRFLRCYGPATPAALADWLGCSPQQARRLWGSVESELEPVRFAGKPAYILAKERAALQAAAADETRLLLLGPHDPYLDVRAGRDRALLVQDPARQRLVWRTVANPGCILKGGRVAGVWSSKTQAGGVTLALSLFEPLSPGEQQALQTLAEQYAAFRSLRLKRCTIET